ncbi:MAG: GNAT family N-acetyltransferase [Bacteroidales bacterium]|nr:GNAT family N-acetyltransferase [Bacteroidales bacterium]
MKLVNDISLIDRQQWDDLVNCSPMASIFQTPEFFDFIVENGMYRTKLIGVEEDGALKGLAVCWILAEGKGWKKRLSSRAIINGGPLLDESISEKALALLLESIKTELKRYCVYIETRNFNDYSRWRTIFEACGFRYQPHCNFHIDTTSAETVEANMGKSRRRDIKYTLREGAMAVEATTNEEVDAFYAILSELYKDKVKRPLFKLDFFHQLMEKSFTRLILVKYQEEVVGGSLCLELKSRTLYEWFVCGRDYEWRNVHPSELATYEAICLAVNHGCQCFDMMGAGEPDKAYGVRDFKAHFGGVLVEHGRYLHLCSPLIYKAGEFVIKKISK